MKKLAFGISRPNAAKTRKPTLFTCPTRFGQSSRADRNIVASVLATSGGKNFQSFKYAKADLDRLSE